MRTLNYNLMQKKIWPSTSMVSLKCDRCLSRNNIGRWMGSYASDPFYFAWHCRLNVISWLWTGTRVFVSMINDNTGSTSFPGPFGPSLFGPGGRKALGIRLILVSTIMLCKSKWRLFTLLMIIECQRFYYKFYCSCHQISCHHDSCPKFFSMP